MRFKTTLRLLVAACLLGGLVLFVERRFDDIEYRRARCSHVLDLAAEDVGYLMFERAGTSIECALEDGAWVLTRPLSAPADIGQIEHILSGLEALPCKEVITAAQREHRNLTLEDYGLSEPRMRLVVHARKRRFEIAIGDEALDPLVYVRLSGSDDVIATSRDLLDLVPADCESIRERQVLHGDAARTARLEIRRAGVGFIQLARVNDGWHLQQPVEARADREEVLNVLDALYGAEVASFAWDRVVSADDDPAGNDAAGRAAMYGLALDEAVARVTVWVDGDDVGRELILGKTVDGATDQVYAMRGDLESVYTVSTGLLAAFSVQVNDLRDRDLFPGGAAGVTNLCIEEGDTRLVLERRARDGWTILQPVQWKADQHVVGDVVERVTRLQVECFEGTTETNLAALGLEPPAMSIEVLRAGRDGQPRQGQRLRLGMAVPGSESVYAAYEGSAEILEIDPAPLVELGPHPADPLVYLDRTVLALPAASVRRISLQKDGLEQSVAREEDAWAAVAPQGGRPVEGAIKDVIFFASNLRATKAESRNPENLSVYGLDQPGAVLRLGLSGEEGIQKSIHFGGEAGPQGVYVMVQGQEVVFVLDREMCVRLTRDIALPAAEPGAGTPEGETGQPPGGS